MPSVLILVAVLGCRLKASREVVKEAVSLGEVVEAGEDVWGGTVGSRVGTLAGGARPLHPLSGLVEGKSLKGLVDDHWFALSCLLFVIEWKVLTLRWHGLGVEVLPRYLVKDVPSVPDVLVVAFLLQAAVDELPGLPGGGALFVGGALHDRVPVGILNDGECGLKVLIKGAGLEHLGGRGRGRAGLGVFQGRQNTTTSTGL